MNVGDKVSYSNEDYLLIKVNTKTVYICKNFNFLNLWENRVKGTKWADLCKREEAFMVDISKVSILEESVVSVEKKQSKKFSKEAEKMLLEVISRDGTKKPKRFIFETGNERIFPLAFKDKKVLFHETNTNLYYFYDKETQSYSNFNMKEHKKGKDIIWPS